MVVKPFWREINGVHKYKCFDAVYAWVEEMKNKKCKWRIALNVKYGSIYGKSENLEKAKLLVEFLVNKTKFTTLYNQSK